MSQRGRVKWFDAKKGFGFIIGPDGKDVFVHYTHIHGDGFRTLRDGESVDYELVEGDKGYQAREVNPVADDGDPQDADAGSDAQPEPEAQPD